MQHILSTITVFFILLTTSVSWSKEVGYGDLRIGSDRSVIDEYCEEDNYSFYCYKMDDVIFHIQWNDENKIFQIIMVFEDEKLKGNISFEEYLKNKQSLYYLIKEKISNQFDIDGIWTKNYKLSTTFNEGTIRVTISKEGHGETTNFKFFVIYNTKEKGKKYLTEVRNKFREFKPSSQRTKELLDRF